MKRIVLGLLMLILCAVVGLLWFGRPYLTSLLRLRLEYEISRRVHSPSRINELAVSAFPVGAHLAGIVIGPEPSIARIEWIDVRLWSLASLMEGRPVLSVDVESPAFDLSHLPHAEPAAGREAQGGERRFPPLHVETLEVRGAQLRFRLGNTPADLRVAHTVGELKSGLLRRSLAISIEATGVELQRKSYRVQVNELRAHGGQDAGGLFVDTATVKGEGITVAVNATLIPHRHALSATFDPGLLGVVVDELSFIGGQTRVDGTVHGDLANPGLDARVVVQQGAIAGHTLGDLETHVTREGTKLSFDDVRLVSAAGQVSGAVDIVIDKEVPIHGELGWHGVDLEGMLGIMGAPVPFSNRFEATTSVHGSLDPLDLQVAGGGTLQAGGVEAPKDVGRWDLRAHVRPRSVEAQLELAQPERNHLAVRFALQEAKLGGTVTLTAADLAALNAILPRPLSALALTGQADGAATFAGTAEHPAIGGTVSLRDLTVVGTRVPRATGDFAIAAGTLTTQRTEIETAAGNAELTGIVALSEAVQNDWQLTLHDFNTDLVLGVVWGFGGVHSPLNGGTLSGTLRCRGPWRRAQTQADVTARLLRIAREPLDQVDVKLTTALPQWALQLRAVHAREETLSIDGTGEGMGGLQLTIDSTPTNLANWRGAGRRRIVGTAALHARFSGELIRPDGWAELSGSALGLRGHRVGDIRLRGEGQRGDWTVKGDAFDGTLGVDATLRSIGTRPYTLAVTWNDTDLARLLPAGGTLHVTTSGEVKLAGSLQEIDAPTGTMLVSRFDAGRDQYRVAAPEPIRIDVERGRFRIRSLVLAGQGTRLTATGEWTTAGQVGLDVQGNGDLVLLELIGPPFQSARGLAAVKAHLLRTPEIGWDLRGQLTVRDAALDMGLPVVFTDTNGDLTFVSGRIRIDRLVGKVGGGEFHAGGAVDVNRGPEVSWTVREVGLNVPEWLEERVSGKGQVAGTWRAMTVSGDLEVLNALYDRRIELTDFLPWFKVQVAPVPRTEAALTEVHLDLHVHASGGLFVDNNFAKAEMRADLRVAGNTEKPVLSGTLEVISGEVTFRNRTFIITGGSIDFRDPFKINPVLNISAESRIATTEAEYTVIVAVSGTADNPRVQFSADDPSLSQNDVLSLVAAGKTVAQLQREGGGVSVADVLALVPTGAVEQRFRSVLGVDRFEIEPAYSRDTGAFEPRLTIGKDVSDRLRVLGASGFGVDAHRSMQIEYRLSRRISLLGTWEGQTQAQAGAFGGDIKFRYEFRRLPFSLLGQDPDPMPQGDAQ